MVYYLLSIPSFWTLLSMIAVFIAYEHMLQASKKTSLARVHSELAEERATAAERDAKTAKDSCEAVGRHLIALEERIAEQQLFLCAVVEGRFQLVGNAVAQQQQQLQLQNQHQQDKQQPPQQLQQKRRQSVGIEATHHVKENLSRFSKGVRQRGHSFGNRHASEILGRSSCPPLQGNEENGRVEARFFSLNSLPSVRTPVPLYPVSSVTTDHATSLMAPNGSRRKKYASSNSNADQPMIAHMQNDNNNNTKAAFEGDDAMAHGPESMEPMPTTETTATTTTITGQTSGTPSAGHESSSALKCDGAACTTDTAGKNGSQSDATSAPSDLPAPPPATGSNIARVRFAIANNIKGFKSKFKNSKNQPDTKRQPQQQQQQQQQQCPQRSTSSKSLSNPARKKMMLLTL